MPLLGQVASQLTRQRGLTGTLKAGQHNDRRRGLCQVETARFTTENGGELFVNNFDNLLCGVERLRNCLLYTSDAADE